MNRSLFCLVGIAVAFGEARGDEPMPASARSRVVDGKVIAAGNVPVAGATVLLGPPQPGMALVLGVAAKSDAQGRFRAELRELAWTTGIIRAVALAPGFKAVEKTIEAGRRTATVNFELASEPWKEMLVRMVDRGGWPIAGEVVTCSLGGIIWSRIKMDLDGLCRIAIPRNLPMNLTAEPKGLRPIVAYFRGTNDEPTSITLPVLPPIRGRVIDSQGWPVPEVAVGRWLSFDADGTGEMSPFFGFGLAVTDRDGNFEIAPRLELRVYVSRPMPRLEALCFAGPSYRDLCYQLFEPNQPIRIGYRTVDPNQPVAPDHDARAVAEGPHTGFPRLGHIETQSCVLLGDFGHASHGYPELALCLDQPRRGTSERSTDGGA